LSYSTSTFPYNCVVLIETEDPDDPGHFEEGSGVIIGPHTILTASHMLWDSTDQDEANQVFIYPGYSQNGIPNPAGSGSPLNADSVWHNFEVGTAGTQTRSSSQDDYAVIDTNYTFTSWMGVVLNYGGGTVHATGYPAIANGLQTDVVGTVSQDPNYSVLDYGSLSASAGNSGGPLWLNFNGSDDVVGIVSTGAWACQLTTADWNQIVSWENANSHPTGFSPTTAATTVYTAEYGTAPSSTELNVLVQFTTPQYAYGQQIGVMDPAVYAYQALGVALASTATHFQNTFGPSNPTYPATPAGDAQFSTDAYASVFGHPGSPAQIQEFVSQVNYFEAIYTAAGVYGNANNIDLLARGAAYGQMLGIHAEIDPTGSASGGASHTEVPAGGEASGTDVPLIGVSTTSNMTHTIHLA